MKIYKRDRIWYTYYTYRGKRKRKAVGPYKAAAELKLKDIALKLAMGEDPDPEAPEERRILFKGYASEYLDYSRTNKGMLSARRDGVSLKHLVATFGDSDLSAISTRQIEQYKKYRLDNGGVKPATINREIACLSNMFTKAVQWGYVSQSPTKGVKLFKEPPGRLRYLQPEEMGTLLSSCSEHLKPIVVTALNTGMRRSEILNLRWSSVNLKMRTITVENSKNNERRVIPINPTLYQELKKLSLHRQTDFVYCGKAGKPFTNIQKGFVAACKRAGITDFRFHDLRHTFASYLVMSGVNLRAVQQLLGHKGISMTIRYSHLSPEHLQEAVTNLSVALSGQMQRQMDSIAGGKNKKSSKCATNTPQQKNELA